MAVPFRRTSKTTKRMRRTHFKLTVSGLVTCPNCGEMIVSHRVCPHCGYYDGKEVVAVEGKKPVETKKPAKKAKKEKKAEPEKKAEKAKTARKSKKAKADAE